MTGFPLPLMPQQGPRCALHTVAAQAACVRCGRGHCGPCQRRVDKRVTPVGSCLQCGGALQSVQIDAAQAASVWAELKHAYGPLGLACSAALALPMLYAGVVVTTLPTMILATAACVWVYFLGVVRWRATAHAGLPSPAIVLEDVRQSMSAPAGFLAVLLALVPALWVQTRGHAMGWTLLLIVVAGLWLPIPMLAAASGPSPVAPLVPSRALAVAVNDPAAYFGAALRAICLAVVGSLIGIVVAVFVGWVPALGPWCATFAGLPALWAAALTIGRLGQAEAEALGMHD